MLKQLWYRLHLPPGIITGRYWHHSPSPVIRQHWQALWNPTVRQSRLLSWLLVLMQLVAWWTYFGWLAYRQVVKKLDIWQHIIDLPTRSQQRRDLWYATFRYGIPPTDYFAYQLYRYPRQQWLDFIYDHEVPKWQNSLSGKVSADQQRWISDKAYFAQRSLQNGIPAILTLRFIPRGKKLTAVQVFQQRSLFFKPTVANRSDGCMALEYQAASDTYCLIAEKEEQGIKQREVILSQLNQQFEQREYIVQPLLENSLAMRQLCQTDRMTTLRIISAYQHSEVQIISAILEVPRADNRCFYRLIAIDINSGETVQRLLGQHLQPLNETQEQWRQQLANQPIPAWQSIVTVVQRAHRLCNDYATIGWDVAVTTEGVKLVEGNVGWGVKNHQYEKPIFALLKSHPYNHF
ncbi:MAG: sugar-transfer associated ATP-grasp domain-containing protein [Saprospiraceae bacterium]